MTVLLNQKIYICSFCKKKYISKNGVLLHEKLYCKKQDSPHMQNIKKIQDSCKHTARRYAYTYIPGECVQEPSHEECLYCGKII